MARKNTLPKLDKNIKDICPFADPKCPICTLPLFQIATLHELRFKHKWKFKKLYEYAHIELANPISQKHLSTHFKKHVDLKSMIYKDVENNEELAIASLINKTNKDLPTHHNKDVETAYARITKMTADFSQRVECVADLIAIDKVQLEKELSKLPTMKKLEWYAKLHKEARDQVKDIESLRSPRIMVAEFLKSAIDETIREVSGILRDICSMMQGAAIETMKDTPYAHAITSDTFVEVFRKAAIEYRERMTNLRREHLSKAASALADLEKIK